MRNRLIALISTIVLATFAEAEEASKLLKAATDNVTLSGLIEVSASQATDFEDHDVSDITLSTAEVALDAEMNEFTNGHILFLHEEDADESVVLDEGTITLGGTESNPWFFTAGKMYLPFGVFSSNMVSDPLTLELGEINQSTAQIGYRSGGFYGSVYGFNCDVQEDVAGGDDNVECFGANVGWGSEDEESPAGFEIGYLSNIADTDGLEGVITDAKAEIADYAGGYSISGNYSWDSCIRPPTPILPTIDKSC